MTEELDAIVFDVGGTLLDMKPTRAEAFAKVLAEKGHDVDSTLIAKAVARADRIMDDRFAVLERGNDPPLRGDFVGLVLEEIGFKDDHEHMGEALIDELNRIIPEVSNWVDYPETKKVLMGLRERGFTLGVVSNATDLVKRVLDNLDLTQDFDFIIISDDVGVNKPSAKIFRMAVEKAGTSPNRILYIGDKLVTDVRGAVGAGMNAVLIDRFDAYPDVDCIRIRDLNSLMQFL